MAKYTRQDILDIIEQEDIGFIRLQFTDISGRLKNMATTVKQIDKILDGHYKFDCKAIDGFSGTGYEELFLVPDLDTIVKTLDGMMGQYNNISPITFFPPIFIRSMKPINSRMSSSDME